MKEEGNLSLVGDDILLGILEALKNPADRKSFSLVCRQFYQLEAVCRKSIKLSRCEMLARILYRYGNLQHLDLSPCSQITDTCLEEVARLTGLRLRSINLSKLGRFSLVGLSTLARGCENLVEIDLSGCRRFGDKEAAAISQAVNLECLKLVKCQQVSDLGLGFIAGSCSRLQHLHLKWCVGISDLGIELATVKCKELRFLDISYIQITNKCIAFITHLDQLETLMLVGCLSIDDEGLHYLRDGCKSLQRLDISKCQNVSRAGIISLINGSSSLKQLSLAYCVPVTNDILLSLQKFESLQSIKFDGCDISSPGLASIGKNCKSLQELSLTKCGGVMDEGISALVAGCRDLKILDLTCCHNLSDTAISAIATSCRYLSCLRMESCSFLVTETGMNVLGDNCHFLEVLDLTDSSVNNEGLKFISRCSELTTLKLGFCPNISDEGLKYIGAHCSNLQELDLYRSSGVGDIGLTSIACGCSKLKMLNLSYCTGITDDALKSLSQLEGLHNLEIRGCSLVTSAGLSAVAIGCKHLVELDIKRCSCIDDVGLVTVVHWCLNLRQINISYCPISDIGLLALAHLSCLQNVRLVHLRNVTQEALAFALLACKSLKKVKLLKNLKSSLPPSLIEHLEAQGCSLRWMEKPL